MGENYFVPDINIVLMITYVISAIGKETFLDIISHLAEFLNRRKNYLGGKEYLQKGKNEI
jgi:hypothetical protein